MKRDFLSDAVQVRFPTKELRAIKTKRTDCFVLRLFLISTDHKDLISTYHGDLSYYLEKDLASTDHEDLISTYHEDLSYYLEKDLASTDYGDHRYCLMMMIRADLRDPWSL